VGDRFEVMWIAAASGSTQMIQLMPVWNDSSKEVKDDFVDVLLLARFAWSDPNLSVASSIELSSPKPAAGIGFDVNLLSQALVQSAKVAVNHRGPIMPERVWWGQ
jgi:hypothetical protein